MSNVSKVKGNLVVKLTKDGCVDAEIVIDGDNIKWSLWIGGDYVGSDQILIDDLLDVLKEMKKLKGDEETNGDWSDTGRE